jgi:hypothetical protein
MHIPHHPETARVASLADYDVERLARAVGVLTRARRRAVPGPPGQPRCTAHSRLPPKEP